MEICFIGPTDASSASRLLVKSPDRRVLIDCGAFCHAERIERNWEPFPVPVWSIDDVVVSSADAAYSGWLPVLVRQGFRGRIFCSLATRAAIEAALQEFRLRATELAHPAISRGRPGTTALEPLFSSEDARKALEQLKPIAWGASHVLGGGLAIKLLPAGLAPGVSLVAMRETSTSLLIANHVGRSDDAAMWPPAAAGSATHLVIRATHDAEQLGTLPEASALARSIRIVAEREGTLLIPVCTLGQAQRVLLLLASLRLKRAVPAIPLVLDSAVALALAASLRERRPEIRLDANTCAVAHRLAMDGVAARDMEPVEGHRGARVLLTVGGGLGCHRAGRRLLEIADDERSRVLLLGDQAEDAIGSALAGGGRELLIERIRVHIRAEVLHEPNLAGDADSKEILSWLGSFDEAPRHTYVLQGADPARRALAERIEGLLGWNVSMPREGDFFDLGPGQKSSTVRPHVIEDND